jgi:acyl carrier protein phosphodiesterase
MNYLGHLVLSGNDSEILFGNFIADAIKGNSYLEWPENIQKGILLHRFIDNFTDNNNHYLLGKRRFYEKFPKMGGIVNDILYDHLLWNYDHKNKTLKLTKEIIRYYKILDNFSENMPEKIKQLYKYMRRDDWLNNYQYEEEMRKILKRMGKRINYSKNLELSFEIYKKSSSDYEKEFELFYNEIKEKTSSFLCKL